ncbi:MAG: hypothetical protein GX781_04485 [Clostridiales bacterium]|nr:hypothetical protein [Clostridiales bacterium]
MDRKQVEEDKNQTIANMNVEGMPWYSPKLHEPDIRQRTDTLTKKQNRYLIAGALKGAMLVAGVLSVFVILFVLFSTQIWLK